MKNIGISVTRKPNESLNEMIGRFRYKVEAEGILKDYKLNVMFSREERAKFKEFSNRRRLDKTNKRVQEAIGRSTSNSFNKKKDGVI